MRALQVWDRRALGRGAKPAGVLVGHTEGLTYLDARGACPGIGPGLGVTPSNLGVG